MATVVQKAFIDQGYILKVKAAGQKMDIMFFMGEAVTKEFAEAVINQIKEGEETMTAIAKAFRMVGMKSIILIDNENKKHELDISQIPVDETSKTAPVVNDCVRSQRQYVINTVQGLLNERGGGFDLSLTGDNLDTVLFFSPFVTEELVADYNQALRKKDTNLNVFINAFSEVGIKFINFSNGKDIYELEI